MGPLFEEPREARPIGDRSFNSYSIGELRNPMAGRVVYALRTPSYVSGQPPRSDSISNNLYARNVLITIERDNQLISSLTGFPTRLSISTSVSMVNLAVFLLTTSDTRGRETIRISAASACFK